MKPRNLFFSGLTLFLLISVLFFSGCTNSENDETETTEAVANKKPIIAVTIVPEKTFVEAVCGDLVETIVLVPAGNSPGNYEPTPQEMVDFNTADLYFAIGVPTEEVNILPNVGDIKIVALQDEVASVYPDRVFASGGRDPHIWLSPKRVQVMIDVIAREMSALDPEHSEYYQENANAYKRELDELDDSIKAALEGSREKKFIVYHPAFGYLADDYGLTMYALQQDGKEATPQHLQEMIDLAKEESIHIIFYQEEIDGSQSEAFAEEIGGETMQLAPLAANYIENLEGMAKLMSEVMQ